MYVIIVDAVVYISNISGDKTEVLCGENNWTRIFRISSTFIIDFKSDFSGRRHGFLIGYREYTDTITNKHGNEL